MKNKFLIIFLFILPFICEAQSQSVIVEETTVGDKKADSIVLSNGTVLYSIDSANLKNKTTNNTLSPKTFQRDFIRKYKGNDFNYEEIKPRESFMQKLMRKIDEIIRSIFGEVDGTNAMSITQIIIRIIGIIILGFLLYFIATYLLKKDGNWIFGKKNKKTTISSEDLHENIHEINFPESILQFERSKDFRSAVRYQFLYILKKMSDKKLINWNPEKTNKDYISELNSSQLKKEFMNLSFIFEYVWYGEFSINENQYLQFKNQYQNFKL